MTLFSRPHVLRHPEQIHPALWRGSQLAQPCQKTISTGYLQLDAQLPGKGWPTGSLIEIMSAHPGVGEIQLLKPALTLLEAGGSISLVNPPYIPSASYLEHWFSGKHRIFWIKPDTPRNTLWAAEKILQHNASAALLCWINAAHPASLRRLHLAARQSQTLFFSFRPASAANQTSIAPLRLNLEPSAAGLDVIVIKRRGPLLTTGIRLYSSQVDHSNASTPSSNHDSLDQHLSEQLLPEQPFTAFANQ